MCSESNELKKQMPKQKLLRLRHRQFYVLPSKPQAEIESLSKAYNFDKNDMVALGLQNFLFVAPASCSVLLCDFASN